MALHLVVCPQITYIVSMDIKSVTSGRKRRPFTERFWEKVKRGAEDDCWEWQASRNAKGYGRLTSGRGVNLKAHRVAFALSNGGEIPDDMHVLHRCDNPRCCNPHHLFLGTGKDNTDDMIGKGRNRTPPQAFGEMNHNAKFDEATARKIIIDSRPHKTIAGDYGVSWMTVFRLKHGKTWKKLT